MEKEICEFLAKNKKYKWSLIFLTLGVLFHLCTVVLVLILSGGKGEGPAFLVIYLDFPLVVLYTWLGSLKIFGTLLESTTAYLLIVSIGGTLMYAILGWCVGNIFDRVSLRTLKKVI